MAGSLTIALTVDSGRSDLVSLNVALVVALTSYRSIVTGLVAPTVLLSERLTSDEFIAGLFLVSALGLGCY